MRNNYVEINWIIASRSSAQSCGLIRNCFFVEPNAEGTSARQRSHA